MRHTGFSSKDRLQVLVGGTNRIDGFNHKKTDQLAMEKQERGVRGGRDDRNGERVVGNFVDQNGTGKGGRGWTEHAGCNEAGLENRGSGTRTEDALRLRD